MDLHVGLELVGLVELLVTVQTFKLLLARVDPQVPVEVSVCSEGLVALVAFVRLLARVNPLVLLQAASVEKPLPAHVTDEGLLPSVASLVIPERVLVVESLPTNAAVELLVLAVASLVEFEGTRGAETSETYFAAEWFNQGLVSLSILQKPLRAVRVLVPVSVHVLLMDQQPAVEEECLPAQIAHERLPGSVDEHVGLELVVVGEALPALGAGEGLLPGVDAQVPLQVVVQAEPGSTDVTGEGLLPGVDHAVSLQSRARPVGPVAHGACERGDACVFPLMHGQGVGVFECLLAHCALVFFRVGVNHLVEAEGVFALELLPAGGAAERSLLRVHGHVTPQLDRCLARLVTKMALQHLLPFVVAQQVVLQRALDSECFATLIAGEGLGRFGALVMLEVVLERLLSPVRPLTLSAGEGQGGFACLVAQKVIFQRLLFQEAPATLLARERLLVDLHVFL